MADTKSTGLSNGDLARDLEKIKGFDKPKVKKDAFESEDVTFTIEVNDESYFYANKEDRDNDFKTLKLFLSGKPFLQVVTNKFIDFMTDENGTGMINIQKTLKKKGVFKVEDLLNECGYIPSQIIKNKRSVPKYLRDNEYMGSFEVYPSNFIIIFV